MNDGQQENFRRFVASRRRLKSSQRRGSSGALSKTEELNPTDSQREIYWNELDREQILNGTDSDSRDRDDAAGQNNSVGNTAKSLQKGNIPQCTADVEGVILDVKEVHGYTGFHALCAVPHNGPMDPKWKNVLRYLDNIPQKDVLKELTCTQKDGFTALHVVCFLSPPIDVAERMIQLCPESLKMVTNHGDTPLGLACGGFIPAECNVTQAIVKAYPEARSSINSLNESPLHIHLKINRKYELDPCPQLVRMVASREAVNTRDIKGHSPLYYLGKASTETFSFMAKSVRFFSMGDDSEVPDIDNYKKSLNLILSLNPDQASKTLFLRDLLQLPHNLRSVSFEKKATRDVINHVLGRGQYIGLLMFEIYLQFAIVVAFSLGCTHDFDNKAYTTVTMVGSAYWLLKRIMLSLGTGHLILASMFNSVTLVQGILLMASSIYLRTNGLNFWEEGESGLWRNIVIITTFFIWFTLMAVVCNTMKGFSVFVHATVQIAKKLANLFLVFLLVFMAFSTMFYVSATNSSSGYCTADPDDPGEYLGDYCTMQDSMNKVISLFFGTLEADDFDVPEPTKMSLFFFNIIVIILLLNIIIAVMSDSYSEVADQAEVVFWDHRFELIHDVDAVTNCVVQLVRCSDTNQVKKLKNDQDANGEGKIKADWFRKIIQFKKSTTIPKPIMSLFTFTVMALWVLVGLFTFGTTWPRHARRRVFAPSTLDSLNEDDNEFEVDMMKEENQLLEERNSRLNAENEALRKTIEDLQNQLP